LLDVFGSIGKYWEVLRSIWKYFGSIFELNSGIGI